MAGNLMPTISIVDDDEAVRDSLAGLIEAHGFTARTFATGRDFLDGHSAGASQCLVLDHHLPDIKGLELLKTLRVRGDSTPTIILTGFPSAFVHVQAKSLGALAVLHKPVTRVALLVEIQRALASAKR